jgi:dolichyl-phosphate-mannose--protein O-mannosyl transferase
MSWFALGMVGVFLFSVSIRFWGLGRFNCLVFDEVYYVKFAGHYLTGTPFFDSQPPLGKYLIAAALWVGGLFSSAQDLAKGVHQGVQAAWHYRWINALMGSLIPLLVAGVAYLLTSRRRYALMGGFFMALDGLLLVESRYALLNIHMVAFGLLGQVLFLKAVMGHSQRRMIYLTLSGLSFGASAAVKWNGLGFLAGIYLLLGIAWILRLFPKRRFPVPTGESCLMRGLLGLSPPALITGLFILPVVFYGLSWIPHLRMNPEYGFFEVHRQMMAYHHHLGSGPAVHPYCSPWYSWPLMQRTVAFYWETIPSSSGGKICYDVHGMGNPALWWFSTTAVLLMIPMPAYGACFKEWLGGSRDRLLLISFLVGNYLVNWLPWSMANRCLFLYYYMSSSIYGGLALAWFVNQGFERESKRLRRLSLALICLVVISFVFWMPIFLGLPLSEEGWKMRMWFRSWI